MSFLNQNNIAQMRFERHRLSTFTSWPVDAVVHPSDLADAGFFYTGSQDRVQCAFNGCILSRWEAGDVPLNEHRKHFPTCPFVLNPEAAGNVSDLGVSVQESQPLEESSMANPSYKFYDARLRSFQTYPPGTSQTSIELAEAGFYYTGKADEVKCFHCDGGLRNWDPEDNPWTEHARWFSKCEFLRRARGDKAVDDVVRRYSQKQQREPSMQEVMVKYINSRDAAFALERGYSLPQVEEAVTRQVKHSGQAFTNPVDLIHAIENLNIPRHSRRHEDTSVKSPFSAPHFPPPVPSTSGTFSKIPVSQFGGSGSTAGGGNRVMRMEERMEVSQEQSPTKKVSSDPEKDELKKKVEALEEANVCKICMDKQAAVVFLDCGHLVCCENCANLVRMCPACRGVISKRVKVFKM